MKTSRSNNYTCFVLNELVERVSGQAFEGFVDQRLFQPLGITFTAEPPKIVPPCSIGEVTAESHPITGAGLMHLKSLARLQELGLIGTKVTEAEIAGFKVAVPKCTIHR